MTHIVHRALKTAGLIVLALAMIAVPVAIVRLGIVPGLAAGFGLDDEAGGLVRRIGMILAFVAGFWAYVRIVEKRAARELSFRPLTIGLSGLAGSASIALPMAALYLVGSYVVVGTGSLSAMWGVALVIFAAALIEEIIFRGVLFSLIERHFGLWSALILPSILFSVLHMFNDNWGGLSSYTSGVLLGLMWSLIYFLTRNVWAAAANHALWNFTIFATGLPLTGQQDWRPLAPVQSDYPGTAFWTGGAAGPEDSWLINGCVAVIVAVLLTMALRVSRQKP